jgi:hypothetical protein
MGKTIHQAGTKGVCVCVCVESALIYIHRFLCVMCHNRSLPQPKLAKKKKKKKKNIKKRKKRLPHPEPNTKPTLGGRNNKHKKQKK